MIRIENIGKKFDDRWILRHIHLKVAPRESVVLLGPSGSGKSVILKIIAGLLPADEGSVKLGSPDIGMLFQRNALFDSLTVEENLSFPLKERLGITGKKAKEQCAHFLEAVGLTGCEQLFPDEISGGMQKRLGIARALIVQPKIILYDEPTAGLDPITSRSIAALIGNLRKETGSTLLTVTNDVQRAYQLGDRICLIAQCQLIEGGTPSEVRQSEHPALRQFIQGSKSGPLSSGLA